MSLLPFPDGMQKGGGGGRKLRAKCSMLLHKVNGLQSFLWTGWKMGGHTGDGHGTK